MAISTGTRLGTYEVQGLLGAGGMGEVYSARDTKLGRSVAIKVLPDILTHDPERVSRFRREAQMLAALNHPNIAVIYGLEEAGSQQLLVMELVEGETLATKLALGPLPRHDALRLALQMAEGLESAHEKGIIHRDLKPANIKITPEGTVKLLDFGLAKVLDGPTSSVSSPQDSPTLSFAGSRVGLIMGTAAYMSPEQAKGSDVDKRADIWAFGVVLYEMLVGQRLFDEPTTSEILAGVLKGDLKLDALPGETPFPVRQLVGRCLTRDVRHRLRDIGEARVAIEEAIAHPDASSADATFAKTSTQPSFMQRVLPWAIAAAALVIAAVVLWEPWRVRPSPPPVTRLIIDVGANGELPADFGSSVLISPDGRLLAFAASPLPGARTRLYTRRLDQLQASPLPGTDGARNAFFSPDGLWIGFFADGKLKKIPVTGGAAVTLCDAEDDRGGSWAEGGWIAFTPRSGEFSVMRVSSDGGTPEPLTKLDASEVTHRWPQVLPEDRAVLYTASTATGSYEGATIVAQSLVNGQRKVVHRGGYHAMYVPTGHLVYISQGTMFAAPFDLERLEIVGQAAPVLADARSFPSTGGAQFSFSLTGSLVYVAGTNGAASSINWMGRDGRTEPLKADSAAYQHIRFSPDGARLAMSVLDQQRDVYVHEWSRGIMARLTSHQAMDANPVWTPDGLRVTFRSARHGVDNLYWQRADGTGETERLTESKIPQWPMSWHPNGRFLAFHEIGRDTGPDIWILPMEGDETSGWKPGLPTAFVDDRFNETEGAFSPDGRWLAYQSDESGRNEVYVRPFPGPGGKTQISTGGGLAPKWSAARWELFYRTDDQKIMVASYTTEGGAFRADRPRIWADGRFTEFDLHPGGERIAILQVPDALSPAGSGQAIVVFNFFEELRRLAPASTH
jgi:serine/threonine-protein kinase